MQDELGEVRATLAQPRARFPGPWVGVWNESPLELRAGHVEAAEAAARVLVDLLGGATARALGHRYPAYIDIMYGHLREARSGAACGTRRPAGATGERHHFYSRFAEVWSDADPELQPRVEHARTRVAALVGEGG